MTDATTRELQAARHLAEAVVEFLLALDEGRDSRRAERERARLAIHAQKSHVAEPGTPADRPRLLNKREAAEYLGICGNKLWAMTAPRGIVPCVKIGSRSLYRLLDLDGVVEQLRVKPREG